MVFSSMTFLFAFLPLVLISYFIANNIKVKNIILCIFSLIFYAWGEPVYILLMLFTIIINYFLTILMDKSKRHKKLYLFSIIAIDLLILFFFKYSNFLIVNINDLFNLNISKLHLSLPIGISFYTFQVLSYVIDVYRKNTKVQYNIISFATYVSLFPQLVAGPIVRYETIANQLENRKSKVEDIVYGIRRFAIGLGKKVLIANSVALAADTVFGNISNYGTVALWFAIICYTLQIYFDFSGYSDMAIGLGRIFGFKFLENFNYPYIADSVTEFWRRWHISLSSWFRDYVYIPLGGNRVSKIKWYRNIFIVWLLTGLWHGANWNFIIWGLYYGTILVLEKNFLLKVLKKIPRVFKHFYTIFIFVLGWTIFRLENTSDLFYALKNMFIFKNSDFINLLLEQVNLLQAIPYVLLGLILCTPLIKNIATWIRKNKVGYVLVDLCIYAVFIFSIIKLIGSTYNPFIYFRF